METEDVVDECCVCGRTDDVEWVDHHGDNFHYASNGFYCGADRTTCDSCGDDVYHEAIAGVIGGDSVCFGCAENQCHSCDDCGVLMWSDDMRWSDDGWDGPWCQSCYDNHRGPSGESKPFSYCPTCHTADAHFHLLSEKWMCDHKAREMDPAYMVLDHDLPNVTTLVA